MRLPEHEIDLPDAIYEQYRLAACKSLDFPAKCELLAAILKANNVIAKPILIIDPEHVGIDYPTSIAISNQQKTDDLLAMFCVYVSLDRRKPISEMVAKNIVFRCLNIFKLRQITYQKVGLRTTKPVTDHPTSFGQSNFNWNHAPWLKTQTPTLPPVLSLPPPKLAPPFNNHWWLHLRQLSWEDFVKKTYWLIDYPHSFLVGDEKQVKEAIIRIAGFWFKKIMALERGELPQVDIRLDWDITMDLVWDTFDKFPD